MKKILILLALCAHFFCAKAQSPFLDSSFATYGRQSFTMAGTKILTAVAIDTSGNIYSGGIQPTTYYANYDFVITKNTQNGVPDNTFGTQGVVTTNFNASNKDYLNTIAITTDQKIVAGGYTVNNGITSMLLARYNSNGTLDNSFGTNGAVTTSVGTYSKIYKIAVQSDDKIVVVGVSKINNNAALVARYNTDGSLDASFGTAGIDTIHYGANSIDSLVSVKIQSGGKIVVGGMTGGVMMLIRLNTNGTIDNTFGTNGFTIYSNNSLGGKFISMMLLQDGSIITNDYRSGINSSVRPFVKKFSMNGAFDSTFNNVNGNPGYSKSWGVVLDFSLGLTYNGSVVSDLALSTDGEIIAAGSIQTSGGGYCALTKLKTNGAIDSSFGTNGLMSDGFSLAMSNQNRSIVAIAIQKDNKILAGLNFGGSPQSNFEIDRYSNIPLFLGNDKTICQGNSTTLNAGNPGSTYLWSTGATTQTISVTDSGNYAVRVTNSFGSVTDTIHIAYYPQPIVNLGNDTTFCSGNTLTLNAQNSGSTYLWNTMATTQTIDVAATGIYSVTITDVHQCVGKDTIQVTVNASPVIVNLGNDTSFCAENSITLNAGNTGSSYLWSNAASSQTINVTTSGTYAVVVTDMNQCKGSDTITVTVNPLPVVNLGNDTTFCAGNILDAQNAGMSFLWSTNATTQTITVNNSGTYSVTVTDANQCSSSDTIQVITNPLPIVNLGNDTAAGNGNIITLNAGNAGDTYLWNTGATSQTINVINSGTYSVVVTNANGCTGTDSIVISFGIVDIHSVAGNNYQWTISPNPARDFINVNINDLKLLNTTVTITDVYGRMVKMITLKSKSQTISLDALVNGLYILKMQNGESMKFVKE